MDATFVFSIEKNSLKAQICVHDFFFNCLHIKKKNVFLLGLKMALSHTWAKPGLVHKCWQ